MIIYEKILSLILACAFFLTVMPITSFANAQTADNIFGVITDSEGNVVEVLIMPLATYVNSVYTIPANGNLITYQYEPTDLLHFA